MQLAVTRRQNVWPVFAPVFNARVMYYNTCELEGYKYPGELISAGEIISTSVLMSVVSFNDSVGVYTLRVQI